MKAKLITRLVTTTLFAALVLDLSYSNRQIVIEPVKKFLKREYSFTAAKDAISGAYPEDLEQKYQFVNLNGLFVRSVGQRKCNNIVRLNDDMLFMTVKERDMTEHADLTVQLSQQLESVGIDFVFVLSPTKMDLNSELLPEGLTDYSNTNGNLLLADIEARGVDVLDLRKDMADTPEHIEEYFYKTDHHWKPTGAFRGFQEISEYLQEMYPEEEIYGDQQDLSNWEIHTKEDWFLGSRGKRTGKYFGGTDDLIWLTPKFDTRMSFANIYKNEFFYGDFNDTIIRDTYLKKRDYFKLNPFCVYVGGNYPLIKYRNTGAPADKKVLIVQDSFVLPLEAFMSTVFRELDVIDMRYYDAGSLDEYILDTRPDVVLMTFNTGTVAKVDLYGTGADAEIRSDNTARIYSCDTLSIEPAAENQYQFRTLYSGIKAGERYKITLDSVSVTSGETHGISFRLYDPASGEIYDGDMLDLDYCEASGLYEWIFTAPEDADNLDILVYAGIAGNTADIGVEVSGIEVYQYL